MTENAEPELAGKNRRVLLVEDQWLIAMDLANQLEDGGYEVVGPAATLEKALELIDSEEIHAGLLDINLDGVLSYPAAEALMRKGIAYAFLSGHSSAELRADFRDQRLISKPISAIELMTTLDTLVEQARVTAAARSQPLA